MQGLHCVERYPAYICSLRLLRKNRDLYGLQDHTPYVDRREGVLQRRPRLAFGKTLHRELFRGNTPKYLWPLQIRCIDPRQPVERG